MKPEDELDAGYWTSDYCNLRVIDEGNYNHVAHARTWTSRGLAVYNAAHGYGNITGAAAVAATRRNAQNCTTYDGRTSTGTVKSELLDVVDLGAVAGVDDSFGRCEKRNYDNDPPVFACSAFLGRGNLLSNVLVYFGDSAASALAKLPDRADRRGHAPRRLTASQYLHRVMVPEEYVDWRTKGVWWPGPPVRLAEFAAAKHDLFGGAFTWPVMVAQRTALEHNIAMLAGYCARYGLSFAPHGKTTMAPALFAAQMRAGAWAMTAATVGQVLAMRSFGVPRVLLANELLDPVPLRWLAGEVAAGFEFYCQVDSVAAVTAMTAALAGSPVPLPVLVELGFPGGRTGSRTVADVVDVARAVVASPQLALAGVTGYEGGLPDVVAAAGFLDELVDALHALATAELLPEAVIVSAGGSAYFDVVAQRLADVTAPGHSIRQVVRSGAYVSHDDGLYRERTPFRRDPDAGSLRAALQVWAQVTSVPEPGLAIVGMGKREVSYDAGLPVPRYVRRADGRIDPADGLSVTALNDHHGYLAGAGLQPGDLVGFGISHPCTAFEKWPVIPVVEDDYTVSDLIRTYF